MNTDDLRLKYGKAVTKYNELVDDDLWTDDYVLWLEKQLLLHNVVVPKGTLCKCKKEFIVYNDREGLNVCTLCGESKLA